MTSVGQFSFSKRFEDFRFLTLRNILIRPLPYIPQQRHEQEEGIDGIDYYGSFNGSDKTDKSTGVERHKNNHCRRTEDPE